MGYIDSRAKNGDLIMMANKPEKADTFGQIMALCNGDQCNQGTWPSGDKNTSPLPEIPSLED